MEGVKVKFIVGFVLGITTGLAGSVLAAQLVGGNGYLHGWDVMKDGKEICSTPYIWVRTREIECD